MSQALTIAWFLTIAATPLGSTHGLPGAQEAPPIKTPTSVLSEQSESELRRLYVTVTKGRRRLVGLQREDFTVFENKVKQELVLFERGTAAPVSALLVLDGSESINEVQLDQFRDGARAFLNGMSSADEAAVMVFSDCLRLLTPFTDHKAALIAELERNLPAGVGTALNDHLYAALNLLHSRQGRRVVVIASDGNDTGSMLRMKDVLWKVHRSDALIYWVRLRDDRLVDISSAWRDVEAHQREMEELEQAVKESGGRIAVVKGIEEIQGAFEDVLSELRDQYVLGYYSGSPQDTGQWSSVKVRLRARGAKVRTRRGYMN